MQVSLTGAVWSLDGTNEIIDKENVNLNVVSNIRCAECPFSNGAERVEDIGKVTYFRGVSPFLQ